MAALSLVADLGCDRERPSTDTERSPTAARTTADARTATPGPPTPQPTVDQVKEAPGQFYGRKVRLTGEVDDVLGDRAFRLEGTEWAFQDNITVLTKTPVRFNDESLVGDDEVIVTGTVRPFVTAEIERDLGWDLDPALEARLQARPVLVADSVRRVVDRGNWTAAGEAAPARPVESVVPIVTATRIDAFQGLPVDFRRERVQTVMGKGLWVGPNNVSQVFVLPAALPQGIQAGDLVHVSGTLRRVPKDAQQQWNLPANAAGALREEWLFVDAATVRELPATPTGT